MSLDKLLGQMPEQRVAELFADIEEVAPASAAKLIRRHDLRPKATDDILASRRESKRSQQTSTAE